MCTTLFLLSTLAVLWRRRFGNRVQPEPSDGAVAGSSVDTDPQSPGSRGRGAVGPWAPGRRVSSHGAQAAEMVSRHSPLRTPVSAGPPCPSAAAEPGKPRGLGSLCLGPVPQSRCQKAHCEALGTCGQKKHFCDTLLDTEASGDGHGRASSAPRPDWAAVYKVAVAGPRTQGPANADRSSLRSPVWHWVELERQLLRHCPRAWANLGIPAFLRKPTARPVVARLLCG
ncbi:photoreceptor disk component PRCD isoform X1 [Artibeus jamaicensis]|uniref:photoreceptor disk component PRCD isoform X1 n=1 Tax=Artibeus jamaicensis TaxID=9417 RepID=UPI00235A654C|nr:photoreceptor disk component PRCD isoform X1 [Artibeus jamaicensis]